MKISAKNIWQIILVMIISLLISLFLTREIKLLDVDVLITYIGILIGFSITIYTFGLSFLSPIKTEIAKSKIIKEEDKQPTFDGLVNGFEELKEDVWIISYCLIGIILVMVVNGCGYNYVRAINILCLPCKTVFNLLVFSKVFFFCLATRAYLDLVKSLLTVSSIIIETSKNNGLDKS